jgi:uncharacterized RDD family membrane protein YckC
MSSANPYAPPRADVRDIATDEFEAAGRGTRLVAAILDGLIFMALCYAPLFVVGAMTGALDDPTGTAMFFGPGGVVGLIGLAIWAWLTITYVSRNGQTIAKKMLGIKVVRSDGSKASLGRIFWLRNVVNGVLNIIPLYGLIDILLIFGERRQCIHDKIADTIVVKA